MFPFIDNSHELLNPAQAAALQRIQEAVSGAYDNDKRITAVETNGIVDALAAQGVSDAELSAARLLLHSSHNYLPRLRSTVREARADEARLRQNANRSLPEHEAWRRAKASLDESSAELDRSEAASVCYATIVRQLEGRQGAR